MNKKRIKRKIKYPVLIFFVKIFILVFRMFPRKWVLGFSERWANRAFNWSGKSKNDTINNLKYIYGDIKSDKEIEEMARQVYINLGKVFADYIYTLHITRKRDFLKYVQVEGEDNLKRAYEKGKGVICLIPHTGSWEFSAITPPILGYETTAVSKALKNPTLNKMIIGYREKRGMKNISRGKAYDALVSALKKGECLIIMIDQDTKVKGVFCDFMGRRAYTPIGAARLALDTNAAVVPMSMKRSSDNKHVFTILPEIEFYRTGDDEKDIFENTQNYNNVLSSFIQQDPTQWVWMHKRWKTTPESLEEYYKRKRENKLREEDVEEGKFS